QYNTVLGQTSQDLQALGRQRADLDSRLQKAQLAREVLAAHEAIDRREQAFRAKYEPTATEIALHQTIAAAEKRTPGLDGAWMREQLAGIPPNAFDTVAQRLEGIWRKFALEGRATRGTDRMLAASAEYAPGDADRMSATDLIDRAYSKTRQK
ncbi:MAG TPA: hypothetical protein VE911_11545, partial [Candidatus Nitrosopolaris sp.]|nr:hypothetical protein [Candidatus Nitrosopolaris sp.]